MLLVRSCTLVTCGLLLLVTTQSLAQQAPADFEVDLLYQVPDIEHPSAVTCDDEGNLFVGEDPMDMRGPSTDPIDRIVLIRWDTNGGSPTKTVFCENLSTVFGMVWHQGMQKGRIMKLPRQMLLGMPKLVIFLVNVLLTGDLPAGEPVALCIESFTVPPSTQPIFHVTIKNLTDAPYAGAIAINPPPQWRIAPMACEVSLTAGETKRVPFTIERGRNSQSNRYTFEVSAAGDGVTVVRRQNVACASAPYHKVTIDGLVEEWNDAIPVTFFTSGKRTILRTYWSRRQFSLLVAVEEDRLIAYPSNPNSNGNDALQIAISPRGAATGTSPEEKATRYEFLFVWTGSGTVGKCFQLAHPGTRLATTRQRRDLEPLESRDANVAIMRKEGVTYYECALDFGLLRDKIRPDEGREFFFSVLVHDPDGTGVRDWGEAAGLWPWQRNSLAWSDWPGAKWDGRSPFDNKLPWGLCSSKY